MLRTKSMAGVPATCENRNEKVEFSGEQPETLLDVFFSFLDQSMEPSPQSSCPSGGSYDEDSENDGEEDPGNAEESRAFWESQEKLVQATLSRTSSTESRIREATKECLSELINSENSHCDCGKPTVGGCRSCLRRELCGRLRSNGFKCSICKSKWRSSPEIPSGEHTYLEVVDESSSKRGEVRVIIELNFRAEFEMARAGEDYNRLIGQLPEIFVGKAERLRPLIKAVCSAAKRCMKQKKIHMGPWRKHKYMQAKWFGTRQCFDLGSLPAALPEPPVKARASMLSFDVLEKMPNLQCTAVEVV